ncbi:T-cell-specific surface glycoprotein CD28 [Frankliniella fusca]|uniref:T-cell-specific surface glycoprotein CD28 n=1 Tax=Frankliniella fusca TaxID=407009 RepID=A0AAE1LUM1_9NEOP|nr:T-cell-specific surface glycoprotein CD28 [Frankliniella fusca]
MLDLDMGMPNTWRAISCAEISQLFKKALTIFRSFFMEEEGVYFTLKILCFPPYTVGKAKTSMSSSKVRDKGMLPSPGAILTPESATKPLVNKVSC